MGDGFWRRRRDVWVIAECARASAPHSHGSQSRPPDPRAGRSLKLEAARVARPRSLLHHSNHPTAVFWRSLRNHVPRFRPAPFALGSPSLSALRSPPAPPPFSTRLLGRPCRPCRPCRPVLGPLPAFTVPASSPAQLLPLTTIPFCVPSEIYTGFFLYIYRHPLPSPPPTRCTLR